MRTLTYFVARPWPEPEKLRYEWRTSVGQAFGELVEQILCLIPQGGTGEGLGGGLPSGSWKRHQHTPALLSEGVANALNDLYYAIESEMREVYEAGLSEGTRFVRRLNMGEISLSDFEAVQT